jgi:hypothetical protein
MTLPTYPITGYFFLNSRYIPAAKTDRIYTLCYFQTLPLSQPPGRKPEPAPGQEPTNARPVQIQDSGIRLFADKS